MYPCLSILGDTWLYYIINDQCFLDAFQYHFLNVDKKNTRDEIKQERAWMLYDLRFTN
jgi:hypothetical protein